ncbi:VOC family protein [Roseibium sp.]|uniref:VOC family protein n=1 Tax=Roseibium sp. TaxID=1936156 RepID=UPI003BA8CDE3
MTRRCSVVHFEMPYDDEIRMASFYKSAFGWHIRPLGSQMNDYVIAETSQSKDGRAVEPGKINGGFFPRKPDWPNQHPMVVIGVDDIEAAMERTNRAGGKCTDEPLDIPGVGRYVVATDTEGNGFVLLQPIA